MISVTTIIGFIFIIIAWIVQLISLVSKKRTLNLFFVWLFLIGVLFLIIGNIQFRSFTATYLNIVMAVLAIAAIMLYPRKKKKT
ncbi:MAG: hypothetical protein HQ534_10455 [Armatimonadetes bacterium]|nr:hypothetical protein [Armatimonadota bacterium]